jgi:hypothetical protein
MGPGCAPPCSTTRDETESFIISQVLPASSGVDASSGNCDEVCAAINAGFLDAGGNPLTACNYEVDGGPGFGDGGSVGAVVTCTWSVTSDPGCFSGIPAGT